MSKFDPEFYVRFRPFYPPALFLPLASELARRGFAEPYKIADVGCGTGHSVASLARSHISARVVGVDPDPRMLARARELYPGAEFGVGNGEGTGLEPGHFDAVTVGSAFHWMDASKAREEFSRVLRQDGLVFVYEYQFPKAQKLVALNEWIRREFNLRWKAPMQRPRGDFAAVTACFRSGEGFEVLRDFKTPMLQELAASELIGLILSQSRVRHYEAAMSEVEKEEFRGWLAARIREQMPEDKDLFDFSLQAGLFARSKL